VDTETGDILSHKQPRRKGSRTLEQALDRERSRERGRGDRFSKALEKTRRHEDLLEKKFEEARDQVVDDPLSELLDRDDQD
jgi:hypothetical protein